MEFIPKVLILEDDELRLDLRELLKREGFSVRLARSVDNLVDLADRDHYDASVIDIRLTKDGTEGLDAVKRLRAIRPAMYLEVITAYREFRQQALGLGADAVSVKPKGIEGLAPRIKRGILEKGLAAFTDGLGIERISVNDLGLDDNGDESAQVVLNAKFLASCMLDINSFLDSYEHQSGFERESIQHIKEEILAIIVKRLIDKETTGVPNMETEPDPTSAHDKNYLGFIRQRTQLEKDYLGKYVAFVEGEFFGASDDLVELHQQLDIRHALDDAFIKKLSKKERVIVFRRPQKVVRK